MYLTYFDTDKIKKYVFGSPRLSEIRGASALLDELNRKKIRELLEKTAGADGRLIYAGGGAALAWVRTEEQARKLCFAVEKAYREETGAAGITWAYIETQEEKRAEFQKKKRELDREIRRKKAEKASANTGLPCGLVEFCNSCGDYPAEFPMATPDGKEERVCRSCRIKRAHALNMRKKKELYSYMEELLETAPCPSEWDKDFVVARQPDDLNEIGEASCGTNHIALLYCDGNNMGLKIGELKEIDEYERFAVGVDRAIRRAVYEALAQKLPPRPVRDKEVFPFEIILIGGDDLVMVTAADKAAEVACLVSEKFSAYTEEYCGRRMTLSAGLVFANHHYPVYRLLEIGESLLRQAKFSYPEEKPAIDFAVLKGSLEEGVQDELFFSSGQKLVLTERPYTFDRFSDLLAHIRRLKESRFPHSKLQELYETLFVSKNQACFTTAMILSRVKDEARGALQVYFNNTGAEIFPWRKDETASVETYVTGFPDLIKLYPYIHLKNGGGGVHAGRTS